MLKIVQIDNEVFDIVFDANAMPDVQTAFATLVYAVLFTEAEADQRQMPDRYQRRGWWFDNTAGSLIWWYRKQPLSRETRLGVIANITQALNSHPALTEVVVTDITPVGNVSSLFIEIAATYNSLQSLITVEL